jgi:hypothetical protein
MKLLYSILYKTPEIHHNFIVSTAAANAGSLSFVWTSLPYFNVKQTVRGNSLSAHL